MHKTIEDNIRRYREYLDSPEGTIVALQVGNGMRALMEVQRRVSLPVAGCMDQDDEPTPEQIRTYGLALMVELAEFTQELNWKPWKQSRLLDNRKVADEFADILAFLGIFIYYLNKLGINPGAIGAAYVLKSKKNIDRQLGKAEAGYGGADDNRD